MHRTFYIAAISAGLMLLSGSGALACSDLPNICAGQAAHNQSMIDIASTPGGGGEYYEEEEPYYYDSSTYPNPTRTRLDGTVDVIGSWQYEEYEAQQKLKGLQNDPRYARYENGGWDYFQDQNGRPAAPGEFCAAFYWKKDGMVRLSGPGGSFTGAMMTFWGPDIPKPSGVERIKVTLNQSDGSPAQTVEVFNYFVPADHYGAIAFLVPSMEALLDNMLDVHGFDLSINGKSIAKVDWTGGFAARDQLRKCYSQRRR